MNSTTKDVLRGLSSNLVEQSSRVIHGKNIDYKLMLRTISQSAANSAIGAFIPPAEGIDVHKISNYITTATTSALVGAAIFNQHHSVVKDILSEAAGTLIGETLSEQLLPHFIHDADYPVNTHIPKQQTKESNFVQESTADITYLEAEKKAQGLTDASNDDIFAIKEHDIFQSLSDINYDIDDTHHIVYPKDKLTTPLSTSLYSDIPSTTKPINESSQKFQLDAHHQAETQATSTPAATNHSSDANNYGVWDYTKAVGRGVKNFAYNMYDTGLTVATKLDTIMEGSMSLGVSIAELGAKIGPQSLAKLAWLETKSGLSNSKNNFVNASPIDKVEFLSEFTASIFSPGALIKGHQLLAPKITKAAINATSILKSEGFAKTLSKGLGFFKESISRPPEPINGYEVLLQGFGNEQNKTVFFGSAEAGKKYINQVPAHKFRLWHDYLAKRGVKFEIGSEKAHNILNESRARGVFESTLIDIETNTFSRTIYLPKNFHPSAFYEECFHALDSLKGIPRYTMHKGTRIDNYELRAKQILINAAPKRFDYDELMTLESHLQAVLQGRY